MSQERRYEKCGSCGAVVENPEKCDGCGKNLCVSCSEDCELTIAALGVKDAIAFLCRTAEMSGTPDADETIGDIFDSINNLCQCGKDMVVTNGVARWDIPDTKAQWPQRRAELSPPRRCEGF